MVVMGDGYARSFWRIPTYQSQSWLRDGLDKRRSWFNLMASNARGQRLPCEDSSEKLGQSLGKVALAIKIFQWRLKQVRRRGSSSTSVRHKNFLWIAH